MCVIIASFDGQIPNSHLSRSLIKNPDGWGFMVANGGRLHIYRGLTKSDFWKYWKRRPKGMVVFHARIATHGGTQLENCHPFRIPGHKELAVCHNGIIHSMPSHKIKSDTRIFVDTVLSRLPKGFLENSAIRLLIAGAIGHSKLVFMDGRGEMTIINEGMGEWVKERWYSNDSWKPEVKSAGLLMYTGTASEGLWNGAPRIPAYYQRLIEGIK